MLLFVLIFAARISLFFSSVFSHHEEHEDMPQPSLNERNFFFEISREHWNKNGGNIHVPSLLGLKLRRASSSAVISPSLQCVVN